MKDIFFKIFLLVLVLYSKLIYSIEIDIKKDITLLKKNDQHFFLRNCEKNKVILETGECLNFLGIKLLKSFPNTASQLREIAMLSHGR